MTKPSYEELARELAEWRSSATATNLRGLHDEIGREMKCRVANQDRVRELYAETLRVRGLLQRIVDIPKNELIVEQKAPNWAQAGLAEAVRWARAGLSQGAESADIGKLDAADANLRELVKALKVACETVIADGDTSLSPQYWLNRIEGLAGSAETGGERRPRRRSVLKLELSSSRMTGRGYSFAATTLLGWRWRSKPSF